MMLLSIIAIAVLVVMLAVMDSSKAFNDKELLYKNCLDSNGLLVQEYGSTMYYCAEVKRIKL